MDTEEWIEIKLNLQSIPPSTRINYLRDLLKELDKKKDQEIIQEILELAEEAQFEIEEQRTSQEKKPKKEEITDKTETFSGGNLFIENKEPSLEEKIANDTSKKENKQTNYGVNENRPINEIYNQLNEFKNTGYIPKKETVYGLKKEIEYAHNKVTTQEDKQRLLKSEAMLNEMQGTADHALDEIKKYKHGI